MGILKSLRRWIHENLNVQSNIVMNILDDSIKNNSSANKRIMSGDWLNGKRTAVLYAEQLRDSKALYHDACGEAGGNYRYCLIKSL